MVLFLPFWSICLSFPFLPYFTGKKFQYYVDSKGWKWASLQKNEKYTSSGVSHFSSNPPCLLLVMLPYSSVSPYFCHKNGEQLTFTSQGSCKHSTKCLEQTLKY
jgi:hypothetical protein